jgi:hypothetical protein
MHIFPKEKGNLLEYDDDDETPGAAAASRPIKT